MRYLMLLAVVGTLTLATGTAYAIIEDGEAFEEDSWGQAFEQTRTEAGIGGPVGSFDFIQFRMTDLPSDLYLDALKSATGFNKAGWKYAVYDGYQLSDYNSSTKKWSTVTGYTYLVMWGPAVTSGKLTFTLNFFGYKSDPMLVNFQAYYQGQLRLNQDMKWTGSKWQISTPGTWQATMPIPEPVTALGVLLAVGGVVGYVRRRWVR